MSDDTAVTDEFDRLFSVDDTVDNGQRQFDVYISSGGDKPIIVVHELPGMTIPFLRYCNQMVHNGFKVYAPQMYGQAGTGSTRMQMLKFCISAEFRRLYWRNRTDGQSESQFTKWLLHLAHEVSTRHSGRKVGVIGMCLTGGFVLVTFAEPAVNSVVCCQPAFPFVFHQSVGLTKAQRCDVRREVNRLGPGCAQGFRYQGDRTSRQGHMDSIAGFLNDDGVERFRYTTLAGCRHSVVTDCDQNPETEKDITDFLNARLS